MAVQGQAQRTVGAEDVIGRGQAFEPCSQLAAQGGQEGVAISFAALKRYGCGARDGKIENAMSKVDADADHHGTAIGFGQDPADLAWSIGSVMRWAVDDEVVGPLHRTRHSTDAQRLRRGHGRHERQQTCSLRGTHEDRAPQAGRGCAIP